ncbi:hypothetical protein ACLOJK_025661 [Asimina triloba]
MLKKDILGDESSEDEGGTSVGSDEESDEEEAQAMKIKDEMETNLVNLRRTIYLTIMSSVDFEEAGHKLLKIKLEPGQEMPYLGMCLLTFSRLKRILHLPSYSSGFFSRYLFENTTSSSLIFIRILFRELLEHFGIRLLNERLKDSTMQESFESIFPKDNLKNTQFSINFFSSIGLGEIAKSLREYSKNMPCLIMQTTEKPILADGSSSESGSERELDSGGDDPAGSD